MSKKVASIFDRNDDDNNDDGHSDHHQHRHQQAFFAGGSEHSGQQILGPERESNLIENVLRDARRHAEETPTPSDGTLPVTFWRNGFTVGDDSELRDYESNREFLSYLRRGEVPPELAAKVRGGLVDVKLDNKAFQDYEPSGSSGARPVFQGEGRRLGAPTPTVVSAHNAGPSSNEEDASSSSSKPSLDAIRQARLARFGQKPPTKKEPEKAQD